MFWTTRSHEIGVHNQEIQVHVDNPKPNTVADLEDWPIVAQFGDCLVYLTEAEAVRAKDALVAGLMEYDFQKHGPVASEFRDPRRG